jgi:hypothetical protein
MKKFIFISALILSVFFSSINYTQEADTLKSSEWNFGIETDLYFTDPFILLPIIQANKGNLHLEARYNYEDLKTASGWIGYDFFGGDEFEYFITPMVGGAVGRTNGIAAGLEFTFSYVGLELYSESEYLFDFESSENNYFYSWTDLTYSPLDWLWFGVSGQRTRLYQTDVEIDRGLILGAAYRNLQVTGYFYNVFTDNAFFILSLASDL